MKFSEDQKTTETALTRLWETVLFHGTRCSFEICCYLKSKGSNPQALILWDGLRATISIVAVHAKTQRAVVPHCPLNSHQKPAAVPPHPGTTQTCVSFLHKSVCRFSSKFSHFAPVTSQQCMITLLWKMYFKNCPKVLICSFHEHEQQDYLGISTFSDNAEAAYPNTFFFFIIPVMKQACQAVNINAINPK